VLPLARFILGLPGDALLLRVAWTEGRDFRTKPTDDLVSLANGSALRSHFGIFEVWSKMLSSEDGLNVISTLPAVTGGLRAAADSGVLVFDIPGHN
jgi:hypothetical protein